MKKSRLHVLVGRLVQETLAVEDYFQIRFEPGATLNAYNRPYRGA